MKIKYDQKNVKLFGILTIVCVIIFVLPFLLEKFTINNPTFEDIFIPLSLFFWYGGLFVGIYCGVNYISGRAYLNNLKKMGYEIPYDKKEYNEDLRKVPRNQAVVEQLKLLENSETSINLYIMYMIIFVVSISWNFWFYIRWKCMGDERIMFSVLFTIFDLFWLISAIRYRKQADNSLYRDECEPEDGRKVRSSVVRGIIGIVIVGMIALIVKSSAFSMTKYIYMTRIAKEQNILCDIRSALVVNYEEIESEEEKNKVTEELIKGVYICEQSASDGEFWREVSRSIGDYSDIGKSFRLEGQKPEIFAQIIDGNIVVELKNPYKDIKVPMISTGKENERMHLD